MSGPPDAVNVEAALPQPIEVQSNGQGSFQATRPRTTREAPAHARAATRSVGGAPQSSVDACPPLSFSQAMVDKFTARAVRGIAVDMFAFSPSGGAMSAPCLTDAAPETAPGGKFVEKAAMRRTARQPQRSLRQSASVVSPHPSAPIVALTVWFPDKTLAKTCADFSDLEIGPDGCLYLRSDKSATIARLGELSAGGVAAALLDASRLGARRGQSLS